MERKYGRKAKRSPEQFRSAFDKIPLECGKPLHLNRCDLGNSMLRFLSSMYRPYVLQLFL